MSFHIVTFLVALVLFFILTPGILGKILPKGNKFTVAIIHAFLFSILFTFILSIVRQNIYEGIDNNESIQIFNGCESKYGCCYDGTTPRTSEHDAKCELHCAASKYGCCGDGKTNRKDLSGKNCKRCSTNCDKCKTTKYGCCYNGVDARQDKKGTNCRYIPPNSTMADLFSN